MYLFRPQIISTAILVLIASVYYFFFDLEDILFQYLLITILSISVLAILFTRFLSHSFTNSGKDLRLALLASIVLTVCFAILFIYTFHTLSDEITIGYTLLLLVSFMIIKGSFLYAITNLRN